MRIISLPGALGPRASYHMAQLPRLGSREPAEPKGPVGQAGH